MSYTEIFKFDKNGNSESVADIKNSYRGCMAVWDFLGKKYLDVGASIFDLSVMERIWNLMDDERVSVNERIVMATTLDKCLVKKEDFSNVITAFREFEGQTSLSEQADVLEELLEDDDCIAVGWHQNSISCEMWFNYNCLEQKEHWWLFDKLKTDESKVSQ